MMNNVTFDYEEDTKNVSLPVFLVQTTHLCCFKDFLLDSQTHTKVHYTDNLQRP